MGTAGQFLMGVLPTLPYPYSGTHEPCALCGSREAHRLSAWDRRLKRLDTVVCRECGLIRTDPMPTEAELDVYYGGAYRFDYQLAGDRPPRFHLHRSAKEAERRVRLLAPVLGPAVRVLDVGSGSGEFLGLVRRMGGVAVGIEPGEVYARFARETHGVEIRNESLLTAEVEAGSLDVVTCHHVLEHLREPVRALTRFAAWLKPDGVLYISVPDMEPNAKPTFERFHFAHVHGFVRETLRAALWRAGLVVDPRFPEPDSTTLVCRKASGSDGPVLPDPAVARRLIAGYPPSDPARHVLTGAWLAPMFRRWSKVVRGGRAFRDGRS